MSKYIQPTVDHSNPSSLFQKEGIVTALETSEGDLVLSLDGDALITGGLDAVSQRLLWFIHTPLGSSEIYPDFGSRLTHLYGKPSDNSIVLEQGRSNLLADLVSSGFLPVEDQVELLPYLEGSILVKIVVENSLSQEAPYQTVTHTYTVDSSSLTIEFLGAEVL